MLKISHTRWLAAALGCLTIAAASTSVAQQQSSSGQSGQSSAATQAGASAGTQTDAANAASSTGNAGATQQQPASSTTQPGQPGSQSNAQATDQSTNQPNAQSNTQSTTQQSTIDTQQRSTDSQQQPGQQGNTQRSRALNPREWPSPERYGSSRQGTSDSRGGQGASLGVSIVADDQGIMISRVHPGTPAQQMGLRRGDRITSVNGQSVGSTDEFITTIRGMNPNDQVELAVVRDDGQVTLSGKLEPYTQALARAPVASGEEWTPSPMRSDRGQSDSLQTSYEERGRSGRGQSGDVESRISRIEQQLEQLTRDMSEIRSSMRSNQSSSSAQPESSPGGQPNTGAPSATEQTPGQPPSSAPPQSR